MFETYLVEYYVVSGCTESHPTVRLALKEIKEYCKLHNLFAKIYVEHTKPTDSFDYALPDGSMFTLKAYVLSDGKAYIPLPHDRRILL